MTDRHKETPQAVRMPGGLKAWYRDRAEASGQPLNALLVAALEDYRQRTESGSTAPTPRPAPEPPRARDECPHPKRRVNKGLCGACGTNVG